MFIHFFCLCPLSFTIKLNFDISKVTYSQFVAKTANGQWTEGLKDKSSFSKILTRRMGHERAKMQGDRAGERNGRSRTTRWLSLALHENKIAEDKIVCWQTILLLTVNTIFVHQLSDSFTNSFTDIFLDSLVKANFRPLCFGAKDNQSGRFNVPCGGEIAAVKLVHLSGYVTCDKRNFSHWSFWGCGSHPLAKYYVDVTITTSTNTIISPPSPILNDQRAGLWFELPGYNSLSHEIILPRFSPYSVSLGQELRLWYGEDLVDFTENDNAGWFCSDVYALYV